MSANSEGSAPRIPAAIPIARPFLGDDECEAVARVLRTGWVSQGPEVTAFEGDFARAVGASFACAVSSCTAALHIALAALDVGPGDEVITPKSLLHRFGEFRSLHWSGASFR